MAVADWSGLHGALALAAYMYCMLAHSLTRGGPSLIADRSSVRPSVCQRLMFTHPFPPTHCGRLVASQGTVSKVK